MSQYEITILLNEEKELDIIRKLLESFSGRIVEEKNLGKKSLSYPIKKNTSANFYNWSFEIEEDKINEFKKKLNFNEKIIRFLLLKITSKK